MNPEFTDEEVSMLRELVEIRLAELGPEIRHTDHRAYRDGLKAMREKLLHLLAHLKGVAA